MLSFCLWKCIPKFGFCNSKSSVSIVLSLDFGTTRDCIYVVSMMVVFPHKEINSETIFETVLGMCPSSGVI